MKPRRVFTLMLPKDVAEFVEAQYLTLRQRFPSAKFTRQALIELYFRSGCVSITGAFGSLDSMVSAFGGPGNEAKAFKGFEKLLSTNGMKKLVANAKSAFDGVSLQVNGTAIIPDKPVRAVPKPMACVNCKGATVLPSGKPCPSCKPVSAGLRPIPAKKSAKPALRLVKKGTEK